MAPWSHGAMEQRPSRCATKGGGRRRGPPALSPANTMCSGLTPEGTRHIVTRLHSPIPSRFSYPLYPAPTKTAAPRTSPVAVALVTWQAGLSHAASTCTRRGSRLLGLAKDSAEGGG